MEGIWQSLLRNNTKKLKPGTESKSSTIQKCNNTKKLKHIY